MVPHTTNEVKQIGTLNTQTTFGPHRKEVKKKIFKHWTESSIPPNSLPFCCCQVVQSNLQFTFNEWNITWITVEAVSCLRFFWWSLNVLISVMAAILLRPCKSCFRFCFVLYRKLFLVNFKSLGGQMLV